MFYLSKNPPFIHVLLELNPTHYPCSKQSMKIMNCTADLICTHLQEALLYSQIEPCKVPVENSTGPMLYPLFVHVLNMTAGFQYSIY